MLAPLQPGTRSGHALHQPIESITRGLAGIHVKAGEKLSKSLISMDYSAKTGRALTTATHTATVVYLLYMLFGEFYA